MRNEKLSISVDWKRGGALIMENQITITRYKELRQQQSNMIDEGLKRINLHMKEGDKLYDMRGGMFGFARCIKAWYERIKRIDNQIAEECDPQEVYCYEYNNHECMYDWDGDKNAYDIIRCIFGEETAQTIRRWSIVEE